MMGDIQGLLKSARVLIDDKDYKEALKIIKNVLDIDPVNYNGLVFCGLCLHHLNKNEKGVQKAIRTDDKKILAYQGLFSLYEKMRSEATALEEIKSISNTLGDLKFTQAKIQFDQKDFEACFFNLNRAVNIFENNGDKSDVLKALDKRVKFSKIAVKSRFAEVTYEYIYYIYQHRKDLKFDLDYYLSLIEKVIPLQKSLSRNMSLIRIYLENQVYDNKAIKYSHLAVELFPSYVFGYENLFNYYLKFMALADGCPVKCKKSYMEKYLDLKPDYNMEFLVKGAIYFEHQRFEESIRCLSLHNEHIYGMVLYVKCLYKLKDFSIILIPINKIINSSKDKRCIQEMKALKVHVLYLTFQINEISFEGIEFDDQLNSLRNNVNAFRGILNDDSCNELASGIYAHVIGRNDKALQILSFYKDSCFEAAQIFGIYHHNNDLREEALLYFLKSVYLNPCNPLPYKYIASYYLDSMAYERALKCYAKCYKLNPFDTEVGICISNILGTCKKDKENLYFLDCINSSKILSKQWANIRLGILQLNNQKSESAIFHLQSIMHSKDGCYEINSAEALGDAYILRGSYYSALKIFYEIMNFAKGSKKSTYSEYRIAHIKCLLGDEDGAVGDLESVSSESVLKFKGLAEVYLQSSRKYINQMLDSNGASNASLALKYVYQALIKNPYVCCLWKLAAECISTVTDVSELVLRKYFELPKEVELDLNLIENYKLYLIKLGVHFTVQGLNCNPFEHSLWHDFGLLYFLTLKEQSLENTCKIVTSVKSLKRAIQLSPTSYRYWNTLGFIAFHINNFSLAQHCFINAVKIDTTYAISWTNLGVTYMTLKYNLLANKAFQEAQNGDSTYSQGWSGQALLAKKYSSGECMDLLRHAALLGYEPLSCYEYGVLICKVLKDTRINKECFENYSYMIEKLFGVSSSCDSIEKFLRRYPFNATGWNIYGILLESMGHFKSAIKAFTQEKILCNDCNLNLPRVYYKLAYYTKSIQEISSLTSLDMDSSSLLSLSYYSSSKLKNAYCSYQSSLKRATSPQDKSNILIALGTIAYIVEGPEVCKTLLIQSTRLVPSTLLPLSALCILGIKMHDVSLILEILQQMNIEEDSIIIKSIVQAFLQRKPRCAVIYLAKTLHIHPSLPNIWEILNYLFIIFEFNQLKPKTFLITSNEESVVLGTLLELKFFGKTKKTLNNILKLVHKYPFQAKTWTILFKVLKSSFIRLDRIASL
ncbi:tetratricopeptide repeat protein 37 isoform X2 [Lepeophtheirus salmonis]|uniref:tetratricopeptide repeat protein 37 isoform X2 n=1 Tax=Lepeophtheirus salmonis TaxID=72036 RepID=UPI001AE5DA6C|nr:tetratricopeptide repeat protein 37-like isoform X2 [Lepeophtheirus salmonis]